MRGGRGCGRWRAFAAGVVLAVQVLLAVRVIGRMARTANGARVPEAPASDGKERLSVLLPVLDERHRLGPCLDGLVAQGPEVAEILVVDGGSTDGTQALVAGFAARDRRVRLVDASPVPAGWNGKAHGLQVGLEEARPATEWLLTIDADVRPGPALARSLVAFARREGVPALSAATRQEVSGPAEAALHPALLTTLVYRFGIPGHATARVSAVQANGQCFLLRRDALLAVGGFGPTRDSLCEDVTLARTLATAGYRVGFYETEGLVSVAMYAGWRDAWTNWTRSLPMRDRYSGLAGWVGLAEVALVQAAPLPVVVGLGLGVWRKRGVEQVLQTPSRLSPSPGAKDPGLNPETRLKPAEHEPVVRSARAQPPSGGLRWLSPGSSAPGGGDEPPRQHRDVDIATTAFNVNALLALVRLGVLVGTARAYGTRPWGYWLSPLCDVPAAVGVSLSAVRRRHAWRGRPIVRGGPG